MAVRIYEQVKTKKRSQEWERFTFMWAWVGDQICQTKNNTFPVKSRTTPVLKDSECKSGTSGLYAHFMLEVTLHAWHVSHTDAFHFTRAFISLSIQWFINICSDDMHKPMLYYDYRLFFIIILFYLLTSVKHVPLPTTITFNCCEKWYLILYYIFSTLSPFPSSHLKSIHHLLQISKQ